MQGVELIGRDLGEVGLGIGDQLLQVGIAKRRSGTTGREHARFHAVDRINGVVRHRRHLKPEGQHVGEQAHINNGVRVNIVGLEMGRALFQEAGHTAEGLKE